VLDSGSQVQNAIYLAGGTQWPVSAEDWEARAREVLEQGPFDYVAGGAGAESTIRANRDAFELHRLRPRMLVGTAERDLSVEVLGLRSPAPFFLAPVGVLSILHEEKELGVARASKATGVPMILSSAASTSSRTSPPSSVTHSGGSSSTGGRTESSPAASSTGPPRPAMARSS
jgi:lactate 2-monooxygenase